METLHSKFETAARSFPDNIAVTFNSGATKEQATYRELDLQACKVAEFLGLLCKEEEVIGVYSRQSIGFVVCTLGVLKRQCCFAPIGEKWPPDTICSFLSNLGVNLVLVAKEVVKPFQKCVLKWKNNLPNIDCKVEYIRNEVLDANGFLLVRKLSSSLKVDEEETNSLGLAFIMQTSGTTGDPKSIKVPHCCILPNIIDLGSIFQVVPDDVVFLASPSTFDPSIVQMFIAFAAGARLVIVPDTMKMVPSKLCQILFDEEKVTILQPTPSMMHYIGQELIRSKVLNKHSSLRVLAFGGESCPTLSTLREWRPSGSNTLIYNLYGITEVSCWASCYLISNEQLVEAQTGATDKNLMGKDRDFAVDIKNEIPLGCSLSDTIIEIRDKKNELVEEGLGQVYLGGSERVCLLGDETSLITGRMRATGDWAYVKDGCIWFCGRKDRQIKRMGKRINLDWIERKISEKLSNQACSLVLDKSVNSSLSKLHLFIVDKQLSHDENKPMSLRSELLNILPNEGQPDFVHMVYHLPMTGHGKIDRNALLKSVKSLPDSEDAKPLREFLQLAWSKSLEVHEANQMEELTTSGKSESPENLGVFYVVNVAGDDMFIASGGSSFGAVRLADSIESWMSKQGKSPLKLPELLDVILSKPFGALCSYVEEKLDEIQSQNGLDFKQTPQGYVNASRSGERERAPCKNGRDEEMLLEMKSESDALGQAGKPFLKRKLCPLPGGSFPNDVGNARTKRAIFKNPVQEENKNLCKDQTCNASGLKTCFCSVRRGNQWTICKVCRNSKTNTVDCMGRQPQTFKTFHSNQSCSQTSSVSSDVIREKSHRQDLSSSIEKEASGFSVTITSQWCTCLNKCIDASPLVIYSPGRCEGEVFIGSHAHVFMCIRLSDGEVLWERRVGDRIESSAALSVCGKYVTVGCYDGKVYVFDRFTGKTHWTFQTGAALKSSPSIDPQTGVVWIGSHDHHLYGIDIENKQCVCTICCGNGSCFSSPCISDEPHLVFIATLTGSVHAIDATGHTIVWSHRCPKPVFASPLLIPTGIVCACVDGVVYCFDFQGKQLWQFATSASVFCSPSFIRVESSGYVLFGSHDKCVYCLSLCGELQWSFPTDAQVYSSPFVTEVNTSTLETCHAAFLRDLCHATREKRDLTETRVAVFVFSTIGKLYVLDLHSGILLNSHSLPGEVFSSPVVVGNRLLVGCRNDYIYSLEIAN